MQRLQIFFIVDGPELHGWPVKRLRLLTFGFSTRRFFRCGPPSQEALEAEFSEKVHRGTTATGDAILRADNCTLSLEYMELAKRQRYILSPEEIVGMMEQCPTELLEMVLPPGSAWWSGTNTGLPTSPRVARFFADIDHRINSRGGSGASDWSVQLTHGHMVSIPEDCRKTRLACSIEHLAADGVHIFGSLATEENPVSDLSSILQGLGGPAAGDVERQRHALGDASCMDDALLEQVVIGVVVDALALRVGRSI